MRYLQLLGLTLLAASPILWAQHHHSHGEAQLYLTYSNATLTIEFISPAMDILGFEGDASSKTQTEAIAKLQQTLRTADALFTLSGSECTLQSQHSKVTHAEHSEVTHAEHSEVQAHYQFTCDKEQAPAITLTLFDHFPSLHRVEGFAVIDKEQQYRELEKGSAHWKL